MIYFTIEYKYDYINVVFIYDFVIINSLIKSSPSIMHTISLLINY